MAKGKYRKWIEPDGLEILRAWARNGLTDEQIAENCGINVSTLYTWKNKYSEIDEALKKGKEVVDIQVENALYKRALGYSYDEIIKETIRAGTDAKGNAIYKTIETRRITKEVQPDVTAQIFWLKNRKPAEWRDKKQVDTNITGNMNDFTLKIVGKDNG